MEKDQAPEPLIEIDGHTYTLSEFQTKRRNGYFKEVSRKKTPDQYKRREYTLFVSEQDIDIILFKIFNGNHPPSFAPGTFPAYPGESFFYKKALLYGRVRLFQDVLELSNVPDPWAVVREV